MISSAHLVAILWLVGGLILYAAETFAPGTFLVFIGAAAAIVGAVAYFVALDLTTQLLLFGGLVVALVMIGRDLYGSLYAGPGPLPQSRAHALIGSDYLVEEAIVHGYGRIRVGDSSWRVKGDDCPAGAKVRVVEVEDGSIVRV
jgi:membrane protein implicated in regulation of membrane protease activity